MRTSGRRLERLGGAVLLCAALAACSGRSTPHTAKPAGASSGPTVLMQNHPGADEFVYRPKSITIRAGTRVTWVNQSAQPHTVTATGRHPSFDSGTVKLINPKRRWSFVFNHTGRFPYYCLLHPYMTAVVIVRP